MLRARAGHMDEASSGREIVRCLVSKVLARLKRELDRSNLSLDHSQQKVELHHADCTDTSKEMWDVVCASCRHR